MPITAIYKAIIKTFDAATYTATVQIVGSIPSYLTGVPVAHHLRANLLAPGAKCGVLFFDETNPTDAAVFLLFGGTPATNDFDVDGDLNVDGLITVAGTVDGVEVSAHAHSGAGQGGTVGHASLSGVSSDQHHAQSHTHSHDTELTGVSADDHHAQSHTHASHPTTGDLTLDGSISVSNTSGAHFAGPTLVSIGADGASLVPNGPGLLVIVNRTDSLIGLYTISLGGSYHLISAPGGGFSTGYGASGGGYITLHWGGGGYPYFMIINRYSSSKDIAYYLMGY